MLKILKSFCIAFSIFSKIPMPQFAWKEEDMGYHLCFFSVVGVVIGAVMYGWVRVSNYFALPELATVLIATAIPILITGGFHIDGFMDTMDALHSYEGRERKLEILKDAHIGAFSVIMLLLFTLLGIAGLSVLTTKAEWMGFCFVFPISRTVSALSIIYCKKAKEDGMVAYFAKNSKKNFVTTILILEGILYVLLALYFGRLSGLCSICGIALTFLYYSRMCKREFGGVTGDTAGYFVCVSEVVSVLLIAVVSIFVM